MNFGPSHFPRLAGAASVSEPDFDIILAVSSARQAALPVVRLLRARGTRESLAAIPSARRALLGGRLASARRIEPRLARFFDLSDPENAVTESMNSSFTRGFQPMLNPLALNPDASVAPLADEIME